MKTDDASQSVSHGAVPAFRPLAARNAFREGQEAAPQEKRALKRLFVYWSCIVSR